MLPPFPPEVTDRIIDFLWADRTSLCNCALTCRAWVPASRYHLFHTLRIWSREAFDTLTHKSCIPATAEMFRFVQHLSIRERSGPAFAHLVPPLLVSKLPNVTSMDIHDFSISTTSPDPSFFAVLGRFRKVTALQLRNVNLGLVWDMSMLLCSFPSLSQLWLYGCAVQRGHFWGAQQAIPVQTLSLTSLTIDGMTSFAVGLLLEWLISTPTVRTLHTFVYRGGQNQTSVRTETLAPFIHGIGASLHVVTVPLLPIADGESSLPCGVMPLHDTYLSPKNMQRSSCHRRVSKRSIFASMRIPIPRLPYISPASYRRTCRR